MVDIWLNAQHLLVVKLLRRKGKIIWLADYHSFSIHQLYSFGKISTNFVICSQNVGIESQLFFYSKDCIRFRGMDANNAVVFVRCFNWIMNCENDERNSFKKWILKWKLFNLKLNMCIWVQEKITHFSFSNQIHSSNGFEMTCSRAPALCHFLLLSFECTRIYRCQWLNRICSSRISQMLTCRVGKLISTSNCAPNMQTLNARFAALGLQ